MEDKNEATGEMQSSLTSIDDFTHVSVDKFMSGSFTKSQYSQVIFHDLCDIYPNDSDIKCTYSLTDNVKPQAGDKIAIFKVGWVSVSDFITFVRAKVPEGPGDTVLEVTFKAGTFPKKDDELYQLCYVTSGNVIAGASTPFSFNKPHESELLAVEDPSDPGLIVFRSRVSQLQSDLEKNTQDKLALKAKYDLLNERFNILKKEFDKCENNLIEAKEENTQLLKIQDELMAGKNEVENELDKTTKLMDKNKRELDDLKMTNAKLCEKTRILENFDKKLNEEKETMQKQIADLEDAVRKSQNEFIQCDEELKKSKDKVTSLMVQIQQLEFENNNLREKQVRVQDDIISQEAYLTLMKEMDSEKKISQTLKQDNELICANLREQSLLSGNMAIKVQALEFKLKELSEKHNKAMAENHVLTEKQKEADAMIMNLTKEVSDQRIAMTENPDGNQYLKCREEKDLYQAQYENLKEHHSKCEIKMNARIDGLIANYETEQEQLMEEKNALMNRITELENQLLQRSEKKEEQHHQQQQQQVPPPPPQQPLMGSNIFSQFFEVFSDAHSNFPPETESSSDNEKQQLKEKLKVLLQQKAELSENLVQVKHNNNEMEKELRETKEENAALKSRISVLEYELATLKKNISSGPSFSAGSNNSSPAHSLINEQLDSLNKSIPIIMKFNDTIAEQKLLEEKLKEEKMAKTILQSKVEFLLQEDAKINNKLQEITIKYDQLLREKETLARNTNAESVQVLQDILEDNDKVISELKGKLLESINERERLQRVINELRKELIGKISAETLSEYKNRISSLEEKLEARIQNCRFMAKYIQERCIETGPKPISCPICTSEFPCGEREAFVQHFDSHMF